MSIEDLPTVKHLKSQMESMKLLLKFNRALRVVGLGSKKLVRIEIQMEEMQKQMEEYTRYPARFNGYLSAEGWLAHESIDFKTLRKVVDTYESEGRDAATSLLLDYYGPDALEARMFFFDGVEELRTRRRFIDFALSDYKAGRYYSVVPLLLMVMDGAVNDAVGKGFHSGGLDLDVCDSLTAADGSINTIKRIFQRSSRRPSAPMRYWEGS